MKLSQKEFEKPLANNPDLNDNTNTARNQTNKMNKNDLLTALATKHFSNVETLETRRMDSLDFHDMAVWQLKKALEEAYEAGKKAAGNGPIARGSGAAKGRETCSRGKNPVLKA
jgi:hypothetical protein